MSNFWRADQPASTMTIAEKAKLDIIAGVLANPLIGVETKPDIIVKWAEGVTEAYLNYYFGKREAKTGREVTEDYIAKVNKLLEGQDDGDSGVQEGES